MKKESGDSEGIGKCKGNQKIQKESEDSREMKKFTWPLPIPLITAQKAVLRKSSRADNPGG